MSIQETNRPIMHRDITIFSKIKENIYDIQVYEDQIAL